MTHRTTLITGANSGLGLEAARQLLSRDGERVVITARSQAKADGAVETLVRKTRASRDRVQTVLVDFTRPDAVGRALADLTQRGVTLDAAILNAGGVAKLEGGTFPRTPEGLTTLFAMNVGGHAQLVYGLLDAGILTPSAVIVFAASEASRGIPAMSLTAPKLPDLPGSLEEVIVGVARGDHFGKTVDPLTEYGLVKLIGNAWIADLAKRRGLRAYAISPGATAGTAGTKSMPLLMGLMMKYLMFPAFRLFGRAHGVRTGAARYVTGLDDATLSRGAFYGSPYPHISGPLVVQDAEQQPLLADEAFAAAAGQVLERMAGARGEAA